MMHRISPHPLICVLLQCALVVLACATVRAERPAELPLPPIVERMMRHNDAFLSDVLQEHAPESSWGGRNRRAATSILRGVLGYTEQASAHYQSRALLTELERIADGLADEQLATGRFDIGNLDSPPDTAFVISSLCKAQKLLIDNPHPPSAKLGDTLESIIRRAADSIRTGGVHTPNHRWHVCATLAEINELYPSPALVARIEEWLAEGIDIDADGQFAERSPHYAGEVVNPALIELARIMNRPELLAAVRANLEASFYLLEPNGEVETVASRRQDQRDGVRRYIYDNYFASRYLAVHEQDGRMAALARWIERDFFDQMLSTYGNPNAPHPLLVLSPEVAGRMPPSEPLPEDFVQEFERTGMIRVRRGDRTATIYGGSDAGSRLGYGSGLAMNPTFFRFRNGAAVLDSIRMAPAFFSTGYFYSAGVERQENGWLLKEKRRVPYHLPMPSEFQNPEGDYALSGEGRFFAKMDFENRPKHSITLESSVLVAEKDGGFDLQFEIDGYAGVTVTIELAFRDDGELSGVDSLEQVLEASAGPGSLLRERNVDHLEGAYFLTDGTASFTAESDTITFGAGAFDTLPGRMENEYVLWVNGSIRAPGQRVYITGTTPFRHTLELRTK